MALTATEEAQVKALIAQNAALLSLASSEPTIISKLAATKVSLADLAAASTVADSDLLLVRQGSTEKSVSKAVLAAGITSPDASTTVKGIVELATVAEAQAGTDTVRAVTSAGVAGAISQAIGGQTAQVLTGSRAFGTTYTNSTNKEITVSIQYNSTVSGNLFGVTPSVGGVALGSDSLLAQTTGYANRVIFPVPSGATYSVAASNSSLTSWVEIR